MKMTINEAIEALLDTRSYGTADIAKSVAIDTMRKYQEIRKIYMTHHYTDEEVIEKIKEVIKYG